MRESVIKNSIPQKGIVRAYTPYANYINEGVSKSGKPLNYTEPDTGDKYFEKTWEKHGEDLVETYADAVNKRI